MKNKTELIDEAGARQTALLFCKTWFEQRDAARTAQFLADDVQFVGTGKAEYAYGKDEMTQYLIEDIARDCRAL